MYLWKQKKRYNKKQVTSEGVQSVRNKTNLKQKEMLRILQCNGSIIILPCIKIIRC
jgi:hypothetical protein